jgi:hypothetical protein
VAKKKAKKKAVKRPAKKRPAKKPAKKNPAMKLRKVTGAGTGWMDATQVKIVKRRGRPAEVLIRKPAKRKKRK